MINAEVARERSRAEALRWVLRDIEVAATSGRVSCDMNRDINEADFPLARARYLSSVLQAEGFTVKFRPKFWPFRRNAYLRISWEAT